MGFLSRLARGLAGREDRPSGKEGARAYGIGDVHGRLDLLDALLARIEADVAARPRKRTYIVFLGDYIDRGPESAGVIERLRTFQPRYAKPIFLAGNHEEVLLRVVGGDPAILADWLKFGGAECLESYGVDVDALRRMEDEAAIAAVRAAVPRVHVDFVEGMGDTFRFGDYLFVHAGIRPGVGVEEQDRMDLRWIREPFLSDSKEHGFVVVHGHTIVPEVDERPNRVGIDTGAYRSGVLTAVGIENEERWFLSTAPGAAGPSNSEGVNQALR